MLPLTEKGFTMIEMIIVIFIVSVAIVGIYSAFSIIIVLNGDSMDRLQATYLSQEGVEIIRNIRDSNWLNNASSDPEAWVFGLAGQDTDCTQGCQADYTTDPLYSRYLTPFIGGGDVLNINTDGFYTYETANAKPTKFSRKITIELPAVDVLKVVVETFWYEKPSVLNPLGSQRSIEVEEVLYNWY